MSGTVEKSSASTKTPADFLKSIRGRPVVVKLNSGVDYRGILACLDGYMNIAMEQTEEYVNGQLKNKYGDAFIRGNNGNPISNFLSVVYECLNSSALFEVDWLYVPIPRVLLAWPLYSGAAVLKELRRDVF
ncbi:OLC1v1011770C1 [Oldenlandia corymbosa var. corymbosa]|uniref:OLC1v1011770C1 n=1 Tax=Oldenlandia corymbosa var. corymbosa TaxID=529605 RepID=A0AAV1DW61_OLDCO|nr:OLC1v1011770C1 [Oldenlandia corymbosa var. corymbosa]